MYVPAPGFLGSREKRPIAGDAQAVAIAVNRGAKATTIPQAPLDGGIFTRDTTSSRLRLAKKMSDLLGIHPAGNG
jgi:hypothetical protein